MKTTKDPDQNLVRPLFEEEPALEDLSLAEDRQRKTIRVMGSVIRKEARRSASVRRLKFGAGSFILAAAALFLVLRWPLFRTVPLQSSAGDLSPGAGSIAVFRNGHSIDSSTHATSLLDRDEIHAGPSARANLALANGSRLQLSENTDLRLGSSESPGAVDLRRGRVDVEVPKLPSGQSFSVQTPDVTVEVHGTHFSVDVQFDVNEKAVISVSVTEGRVSVNRAGSRLAFLDPGQTWSTLAGEASKLESIPSGSPAVASSVLAQKQVAPKASMPENLDGPRSTLAEENRLFRAAVSAARSGQDSAALSLFEQLISRYPQSPLLQQARVERMRCLKRLGREGAASKEAQQYLHENPDGFARDEAQKVLSPAASSRPRSKR